MNVGIIGGGAAGLAAGYILSQSGHKVSIYETSPFLGGQASTFDVGGSPLERGYHHLFTSDTDIIALIGELGLGHRLKWIESTVGIFYNGRVYNFVTPLDLLRFNPISMINRFRLGLVTLYLKRYKDWKNLESITADKWIKKFAGPSVYNVVWGPLLRGKFGDEYFAKVAMPWFWGKIQTRFASRGKGLKGMQKEKLGYPMGSFGEIFKELSTQIHKMGNEVKISTPVKKIMVSDGRASGLEYIENGKICIKKFDAILSTTPSYIFPKLVEGLPEWYLNKLGKIDYLAAVLLILILDRPISNIYWLNIADRTIPFVGLIEHTNLIGPHNYGGKHIVYLTNYLNTDHPLYNKTHEELLEEYIPHLTKINPDFKRSWIENSYHHKVNAAQPIVTTNYSEIIPEHRTPIKGLYLANTTQVYPEDRGTNYSVRMGKKVAKYIIDDLA